MHFKRCFLVGCALCFSGLVSAQSADQMTNPNLSAESQAESMRTRLEQKYPDYARLIKAQSAERLAEREPFLVEISPNYPVVAQMMLSFYQALELQYGLIKLQNYELQELHLAGEINAEVFQKTRQLTLRNFRSSLPVAKAAMLNEITAVVNNEVVLYEALFASQLGQTKTTIDAQGRLERTNTFQGTKQVYQLDDAELQTLAVLINQAPDDSTFTDPYVLDGGVWVVTVYKNGLKVRYELENEATKALESFVDSLLQS